MGSPWDMLWGDDDSSVVYVGSSSDDSAVEKTVTPAVAKDADADTAKAQQAQAEARARRAGISSTYKRYASESETSGKNGSASKLG